MRRRFDQRSAPKRGYLRANKHNRHWLSATPHVVEIHRQAGTFTVEARSIRVGPYRTLQDPVAMVITAPLVELSPATRRRLRLHQVLSLRVSGPIKRPARRWTAHYWKSGQLRAIRDDARRLYEAIQTGLKNRRVADDHASNP